MYKFNAVNVLLLLFIYKENDILYMANKQKIKVGITIGDLNGVGSEIILKTFLDARMFDFCIPVLFASHKSINFLKKHFGLGTQTYRVNDLSSVVEQKLNVLNCWNDSFSFEFGKETKEAGALALVSLEQATAALKAGEIDALLTAPINKKNIQSETFNFPGHTDYLAQELGGQALMFMVSDELKVGLLTDHVAVKDVPEAITPELIREKVAIVKQSLVQDYKLIKPKIAVLGINPHCGDSGVIGKEDDEVLRPVIAELFEEGTMVFGPYAADSFFGSDSYKNFDAIIASYHDQGLIPFKTLTFGEGVNYTAGLDYVRTSPDHGTGYDIAGKGVADVGSFQEALFAAIRIVRNRTEYNELTKNVLKKQEKI